MFSCDFERKILGWLTLGSENLQDMWQENLRIWDICCFRKTSKTWRCLLWDPVTDSDQQFEVRGVIFYLIYLIFLFYILLLLNLNLSIIQYCDQLCQSRTDIICYVYWILLPDYSILIFYLSSIFYCYIIIFLFSFLEDGAFHPHKMWVVKVSSPW